MANESGLVVITGVSKGIGLALCEKFIAAGWKVVGLSRSETPELERFSSESFFHHQVDLSAVDDTEQFTENFLSTWSAETIKVQKISKFCLINNAASLGFWDYDDDKSLAKINQNMQLNLVSPLWLMRKIAFSSPISQLNPVVINISSGAAEKPYCGWFAYCTSKAGLSMATKVAAEEFKHVHPDQKSLFADYAPGVVNTDMQTEVRSADINLLPMQPKFIDLYESGSLIAPEMPASEMLRLTEEFYESIGQGEQDNNYRSGRYPIY